MTRQITNAPFPEWKHLLKVILDFDSVDDDKILDTWLKGEDFGFLLSRSAWSLSIIAQIRHLITQSEVCVWLPDYFCNSSIAPLRELDTNLVFYPILDDGSPNIEVCNELLNQYSPPDLFIAVHYFGYLVDLKETSEFVEAHKSWLVEDAAHILLPDKRLGIYSHYLIFSPHKFLPIPQGAILVVKRDKLEKEYNLTPLQFQTCYEDLLINTKKNNLVDLTWVIKRSLQKLGFKNPLRKKENFSSDEFIMDTKKFISPKMTRFSKKLLSLLVESFDQEIRTRKENYKNWKASMKKVFRESKEIFNQSDNPLPYVLGLTFPNESKAQAAFLYLQNLRIPVSSWPDLPPEAISNSENHKLAITLRQSSIFLPVHKSINLELIRSFPGLNR